MVLVNTLKTRYGAERVALGRVSNAHGDIRLACVSQLVSLDRRQRVAHRLEAALQESVEQRRPLQVGLADEPYDPDATGAEPGIRHALRTLQRTESRAAVIALPLAPRLEPVAALVLEFGEREPAADALRELGDVAFRRLLATALAQVAAEASRRKRDLRGLWRRIVGTTRTERSRRAVLAGGLFVVLALLPLPDRLSARAHVRGGEHQVVTAPEAGFVAGSMHRAGDVVQAGEVLAALDTREVDVELARRQSELDSLAARRTETLARRDQEALGLVQAEIRRAEAELSLVRGQRARFDLETPIDGVIVAGDLGERLGARVEPGEVLFEIASLDRLRLEVELDEADLGRVARGATGRLRLAALPSAILSFEVEAILPVATVRDGRNLFRALARLDDETDRAVRASLQIGMQGVARIDAGHATIAARILRWLGRHLGLWWWRLSG